MIKNIFDECLDWIWPRFCLGCQREGGWVCVRCWQEKMRRVEINGCPGCGDISSSYWMCQNCQSDWSLAGLVVCWQTNDLIKRLVHFYKYFGIYSLSGLIAGALADCVGQEKYDLVVSVPISRKRFGRRGFNQSELIAQSLAKQLGVRYENVLFKIKETHSQVGLSRNSRLVNVVGSFAAIRRIDGGRVLLVDDVCTTMATLNECTQILKTAGAREVVGVVMARGL